MRRSRGLGLLLLAACLGCARPPHPQSVVLVVVDTLRADHLGAYGYSRDTTPAIDALVPEARVFEQMLAPSPWTLPSFASILSGRWPAEHGAGVRLERPENVPRGVRWAGALDPDLPTVATRLNDAGFGTAAILNNSWLKPRMGLARGFDHYDLISASNRSNRAAEDAVDAALKWIEEQGDEPFFLLLHLFEPHLAYRPPLSVRGRFMSEVEMAGDFPVRDINGLRRNAKTLDEARKKYVTAVYDEEIAYVDLELGRFFGALRERGVWDRSLVMLTADHGEELFDHDGFEHGHSVYQELIRVPLLVWGPGVVPGRERTPVSLVDLAPTVLDALGLELLTFSGISLWPNLSTAERPERRSIYADRVLYGPEQQAIVRWPYKLVTFKGKSRWLFDLESDPGERKNLRRKSPEVVAELEAELEKMGATEAVTTPVELDQETVRDLRSLGYLSGPKSDADDRRTPEAPPADAESPPPPP